jgi:hypothetical protein
MNVYSLQNPPASVGFRLVMCGLIVSLGSISFAAQPGAGYQDRRVVVPQVGSSRTTDTRETAVQSNRLRPAGTGSMVRQAAHSEMVTEYPPRLVKRHNGNGGLVQQVAYGCDCGQCVGEPTCGYEGGYEVGCGAESCGVAGCDGCCEPACGSEGFFQEASCGLEPYGAGGCDACGEPRCVGACGTDSYNFCLPIFRIEWCRFEFFAGVNGFTGPANYANTAAPSPTNPADARAGSSSFGFYEGLNEGRSLKPLFGLDLSSQFGFRATQTGLSGTEFTPEQRNQVFVTGGLFRRVDFGLQYGVVVDYLNDDWWFQNDLVQLRGELSWNDGCRHEFGYQFMAGVDDSTSDTSVVNAAGTRFRGTVSFEPTDQHRFFFRGTMDGGGQYFAFIGGTDQSDGLLGAGLTSRLQRGFAYQAGATYLIPNEGRNRGGNQEESWNLSMGVVYRPGGRPTRGNYSRPMFDVADNGTFMVDRL